MSTENEEKKKYPQLVSEEQIFRPYEELCMHCQGTCRDYAYEIDHDCQFCRDDQGHATGIQLTGEGMNLLFFIERHLRMTGDIKVRWR